MKFLFTALLIISLAHSGHSGVEEARNAMSDRLWDVASLHLRKAVADEGISPESRAELLLLLAESLIRGNKPDEAITFLEDATLEENNDRIFWMGQAMAGKGRYEEAVEILSPLAGDDTHPFQSEAAFTSASLLLSLSKPDEALEILGLLTDSSEQDVLIESRLRRCEILLDLERIDEARSIMPELHEISPALLTYSELIYGHLLLAEGKPELAEPLFNELLAKPEGQSLESFNLAAIAKADAMAAQGKRDLATESLLAFVTANPETARLNPIFTRIVAWLPEKIISTENPTLLRLGGWLPQTTPRSSGFINTDNASALGAWPRAALPITDLEAFSLHARALALHRIESNPAAHEEAHALLRRLQFFAPRHFLTPHALLTLAQWKLEEGQPKEAFSLFETLRLSAKSPIIRGEAAFLSAMASFESGDNTLAAELFEEAAGFLEGEEKKAASMNAALSRLNEDPSASITIQNADEEPSPELEIDLALEKALLEKDSERSRVALDEFLKNHPGHPRAVEARLAIAEVALRSVPPDLSSARAQLDLLATSEVTLAPEQNARMALARLRLLDLSGEPAATIALARLTMDSFPGTRESSEAAFIMGKNLYQSGIYNEARLVLEKLAATEAGTQRAQASLLIAARAAALGATSQSREEALSLFDQTISAPGPLKTVALLEKSRLLIDLNRIPDAIDLLSETYTATPKDDPASLPTGLLLAEAIYAKGDDDPASLGKALEIYDSLIAISSGNPAEYFRLQYLRGLTLEKLPDPEDPSSTLTAQAKQAYYSVVDRPTDPKPPEWEWFERSGFRLLSLLESDEEWEAAISTAEKIASFGGPRAKEASTRARQLRLKHMIWKD
ncbi:MAG: tetratricopeptide repeat protein [Akkermansiaceae bacterium]|nr:tetratricopeptide repeat protein [Akkermansiaceae bacterium]MDP4647218.1 tetratricopeptide repeat protein [Akkermansiaceae bacterium]MDP4899158.1 tetratricopeptide repeat protein [Akkermansiaceae bacterium]